MLKYTLLVVADAVIGVALAGGMLAIILPLLITRHMISPGDFAGSLIVVAVLALSVSVMLLRPGGALQRLMRDE